MIVDILTTLAAATGIAAALVGGIFFAFSGFVMAGLRRAGSVAGVQSMQQINIAVINPLFFLFFLGTAVLTAATAALTVIFTEGGAMATAGAVLYILGCIGVTGLFNVPLNNALARVAAGTAESDTVWAQYLSRWTFWNHVRTLACIIAAGFILSAAYRM